VVELLEQCMMKPAARASGTADAIQVRVMRGLQGAAALYLRIDPRAAGFRARPRLGPQNTSGHRCRIERQGGPSWCFERSGGDQVPEPVPVPVPEPVPVPVPEPVPEPASVVWSVQLAPRMPTGL